MRLWRQLAPRDWQRILKAEAATLGRDLVRNTPPLATKTKGKRGSSPLTIGKAAVKDDHYRALRPLQAEEWESPAMKRAIRERDYKAANDFIKYAKVKSIREVTPFDRQRIHNQRNSRGRVSGSKRVATLDNKEWRRNLAKAQNAVGRAKSGWAVGWSYLGGRPPRWVSRHGAAQGTFRDRTTDETNPFFQYTNKSTWAGSGYRVRQVVARTMRYRANALATKVQRAYREQARKAGLTPAA